MNVLGDLWEGAADGLVTILRTTEKGLVAAGEKVGEASRNLTGGEGGYGDEFHIGFIIVEPSRRNLNRPALTGPAAEKVHSWVSDPLNHPSRMRGEVAAAAAGSALGGSREVSVTGSGQSMPVGTPTSALSDRRGRDPPLLKAVQKQWEVRETRSEPQAIHLGFITVQDKKKSAPPPRAQKSRVGAKGGAADEMREIQRKLKQIKREEEAFRRLSNEHKIRNC